MSERIHGLAQLLPDKTAIKDYGLEELQLLTKRFPYFAPAQFLLLQKLKESGSPAYEVQQCKALLYFHDPLQFDYFISAGKFSMDEGDLYSIEGNDVEKDKPAVRTAEAMVPPADAVNSEIVVVAADPFPERPEAILPPAPEATVRVEDTPVLTEPDTVWEAEETALVQPVILAVTPLAESRSTATAPNEENLFRSGEKEGSVPDTMIHPEAHAEKRVATAVAPKTVSATAKGADLLFEPLHTVDYFASQGIKISAEGLPKDKLSQQLRSFTEWLKVMKRLPAAGIEAAPHTTAEKTVAHLASHSVEGSDVVTEAMAEVWARQGNNAKAIETYNKLSLQNPSKKAYFAAKIENLSGT